MSTTTFAEIVRSCDMVLFNNASNYEIAGELELEMGKDQNPETEDSIDIFQWFAVSKNDGEYISSKTDLPLYYSEKLDLYIIGITFFGMSWDGIEYDCE